MQCRQIAGDAKPENGWIPFRRETAGSLDPDPERLCFVRRDGEAGGEGVHRFGRHVAKKPKCQVKLTGFRPSNGDPGHPRLPSLLGFTDERDESGIQGDSDEGTERLRCGCAAHVRHTGSCCVMQ